MEIPDKERSKTVARLAGVTAVAILMAGLAAAQLGRGTFTGSVTDKTGAAIPGVRVVATNTGTGAKFVTVTTAEGNFTLPNLPIGVYDLSFEAQGFNKHIQRGVELSVAEVRRVDVTLEVGSVSQSIEVTAALPRLQTDSPEVATNLQSQAVNDLPLAIGGGGRTMEDLVYKIVPGAYGSTWEQYVVGSQRWTKLTLLEGANVVLEKSGHFGESSMSMEAVQEFKVHTSAISAEFGRTQGSVFQYVLKSGTNEVHGSGYGMLRNEALNANTFANKARGLKRDRDRKYTYAFSFGGPILIPKAYDGRNKSFFYAAYERYNMNQLLYGSPNISLPPPEFYDGDLSRLLQGRVVGTDALGRSVFAGAVYDPASFRQLENGRWIGEMFPGNRIPVSRFSQVSRNINSIMKKYYLPTVVGPDGTAPLQNNAFRPIENIYQRDQWQFSLKLDHNFSDYHKLSGSYVLNHRPRLQCGDGVWNATLPDGGPLSRQQRQLLRSQFWRLAYDWTASPTVLNHFLVFFNRFLNDMPNTHVHIDGAAEYGIKNLSTKGYPIINWATGPYINFTAPGHGAYWFTADQTWGLVDTISFSRGRHFMKTGVDTLRVLDNFRGGQNYQFNFSPVSTAIPNEPFSGNHTGHGFASYLLGIAHSGSMSLHVPFGYLFDYAAVFFQDDYKASNKLSLQLGVRWDYMSPLREKHDKISSWSLRVTDPISGLPGAYEFLGKCAECNGRRYFGKKDYNNVAPRIGFAWQALPKTTVRGAYAIFFQGVGEHISELGDASRVGFKPSWALAADPIQPWVGRFRWDDGFPLDSFQPPVKDVSWGNRNRPGMFESGKFHMPYTQRWNLNVQREIAPNLVLDIGYLGVKSTALYAGHLNNLNQLAPSLLQEFGRNLTNPVRSPADAARNGIRYPFPGFQGTVAGALRQYPQVQGTATVAVSGSPLGFSTTHSLQVVLDKRLSRGLNAYINYTWQKTLTNVDSAKDRQTNVPRPLDTYNLKLEKSLANYDVPHMLKAYVAYELPVGRRKALWSGAGKFANAVVGGWSVAAILNYLSGTPLIFSGASWPLGWNGATQRIDVLPGEMKNRNFKKGNFDFWNPSSSGNTYLNKAAYADVPEQRLGTAAPCYSQARGFGTISEDFGLQKNHYFAEKYRFQIRAEFLNLFNRHYLGNPVTNIKDPLFGQVTSVTGNRSIQIGARFDF